MDKSNIRNAVNSDFGVSRTSSITTTASPVRNDLVRVSADIHNRASDLLNQSAPETLGQKIMDAILPSTHRDAKRRGDKRLVEAAINADVTIYETVRGAQVAQFQALAETYAKSAELQTTEEIAMRGIETATVVDQKIEQSGGEFDKKLDEAVKQAASLESTCAKHSAADRLERRINMRAKVEEAAMQGVSDAVLGIRAKP